ncbi:hypothetical protein NPIL_425711 [Nephila pilipes]|uniref:Uncharacterized protein n=1 Tax=Nephila pilipes TaxID=299642 RepID=A0A8X6UEQ7_NEPPI|nr:hypothetical protein NPIL_425711 [Nephila pilipes]
MLDSFIRVSRRVGWFTDLLRRNTVCLQIRTKWRGRGEPRPKSVGTATQEPTRTTMQTTNRRQRVGATVCGGPGRKKLEHPQSESTYKYPPSRPATNEWGAASSGRGRVHPGRTTSWAR